MKETDDVIPGNEEKIFGSLGYVTLNFVATNDENFKLLNIWQICTYDIKKIVIESQCNQTTLDEFFLVFKSYKKNL
jgi:hypothetical protein